MPRGQPRRELLIELVAIDLEYRWLRACQGTQELASGRHLPAVPAAGAVALPDRPTLRDYLACYPTLGKWEELPKDLIAHERNLRHRWGDTWSLDPGSADAMVELPADWPKPPAFGQRFRAIRLHAEGGLGRVYVAEDLELGRTVALKEIRQEYRHSCDSRDRFVREAEITGRLEHPGVVPVYSLGFGVEGPYYAMRFIQGETLTRAIERLHRGQGRHGSPQWSLQLRRLLTCFVRVCETVEYAHSRGVLHRDLKPSNILLGRHGETFAVDWGLAKVQGRTEPYRQGTEQTLPTGPDDSSTVTGAVLGTPAYMSPEQASGTLDDLTPASDIYSLGATLFHLLVGQSPLGSADLAEWMNKVRTGDLPRPRAANPKVPRPLEAVCLKAMALRPADRYPTCQALADDLEAWLGDEPVSAFAEPPGARLARWARRHRTIVAGVLLTLAITVVGLATGASLLSQEQSRTAAALRAESSARARADASADLAEKRAAEAQANLYMANMHAAEYAWANRNAGEASDLLQRCLPVDSTQRDHRHWEWHYQDRLLHEELHTFEGHTDLVLAVAFSPSGRWLATGGADSTVIVLEVATRQLVRSLPLGASGAWCVRLAFAADGSRLVAYGLLNGKDGFVSLWDVATWQFVRSIGPSDVGAPAKSRALGVTPDGSQLLTQSPRGEIEFWDLASGKKGRVCSLDTPARGLSLSRDGRWLAAHDENGEVTVWEALSDKAVHTFQGQTLVAASQFSPDATLLAISGPIAGEIQLRDLGSGQVRATLRGHRREVYDLEFSPDGLRLASASMDGSVVLWDPVSGKPVRALVGHTGHVGALAFSPDGLRLASAGNDCAVKLWDPYGGQILRSYPAHPGGAYSVCFGSAGAWLASAGREHIHIRDVTTGEVLGELAGHTGAVHALAASPVDNRLASAGDDRTVRIWDVSSGKAIHIWLGEEGPVRCISFSPDGKQVASGSVTGSIHIRDTTTGALRTLAGHGDRVRGLCFSPDGKQLASASNDYTVRIWDWERGDQLHKLPATGGGWFAAVAYSPDGRFLVSGSGYQVLTVWDPASGKQLHKLSGHSADVLGLAFGADSQRLYSAGADQTVKVWDTAAWRVVRTLADPSGYVYAVAVHPDGQRVASASADGAIRVWDGRPLSPSLKVEREALGLVEALLGRHMLKAQVQSEIRGCPEASEEVKERALELLEFYHDRSGVPNNRG